MLVRVIVGIVLICSTIGVQAQSDSILTVCGIERHELENLDTVQAWCLMEKNRTLLYSDPETYFLTAHYCYLSAEKYKDTRLKQAAILRFGNSYIVRGEYDSAQYYFDFGIQVVRETGDSSHLQGMYMNKGVAYYSANKLRLAVEYYIKSVEVGEKMGQSNLAFQYSNIAIVYLQLDHNDNFLKYTLKSLENANENNDSSVYASAYNNLGIAYKNKEMFDSAYYYYKESLKYALLKNDGVKISDVYTNLSNLYLRKEQLDSAIIFANKAIETNKKFALPKSSHWELFVDLANIYRLKNNVNTALAYLDSAKSIGDAGILDKEKLMYYKQRADVLAMAGDYKSAFLSQSQFITLSDSINAQDKLVAVTELEERRRLREIEIRDSLQLAVTNRIHQKKEKVLQDDNESKQRIIYWIVSFSVVLMILLFYVGLLLKQRRKNQEVIKEQRDNLEVKNQEILDSITYAKRIQSAILPPSKAIKEYLPDSFVLFKPKDIVAGDFYWMEPFASASAKAPGGTQKATDSKGAGKSGVLFAAADCTGHGVPGAMVSVVCNNGLNRSVREHGLIDPGKILDKTRELVIAEFEKAEEEVKDGMDIALCSLSLQGQDSGKQIATLKYAGAHNPLWIIRKSIDTPLVISTGTTGGSAAEKREFGAAKSIGSSEYDLYEIKANKQPIGKYDNPQPYTTHSIELSPGDTFYVFSDGYVDQFGGQKGKKFKAANFKHLLLSIQAEPMGRQRELINEAFENWKGQYEQLDDVCVIGVRV